ncbi:MAG: indolepyruvate oxidoreductase subunit beta [Bacteroidales bacterium]|nr:indolepyruvate oxidoreductase subunit beta [Bacteroidales bacterium]
MKKDIILAGVGGQGILSIAAIIDWAALKSQLQIKQAEVHGMSQRGGAVQSHLRISDSEIFSDLIPQGRADIILSVEPMESLRYLSWLSDEGWVISASDPFKNVPDYPDEELLFHALEALPRKKIIDAVSIARDCGNAKSSNIVMLGAASGFLGIDPEMLKDGIRSFFGRKGEEVVGVNLKAFEAGRTLAERK